MTRLDPFQEIGEQENKLEVTRVASLDKNGGKIKHVYLFPLHGTSSTISYKADNFITKTRLFKYIENFTTKN